MRFSVPGIKSKITTAVMLVWGSFLTCAMATLMAGHWVSLPHPAVNSKLAVASEDAVSEWTAFHFLYVDCACSRRILATLSQRDPLSEINEHIVLIGEDRNSVDATAIRGYTVTTVTPKQLKQRFNIEAAPLLMVVDDEAVIRYSGGYTSRKQGLDIQDVAIIRSVRQGKQHPELPVYGCAVSQNLKQLIDPLNLKSVD